MVVRPQQNVRRIFEIAGVLAMFSGESVLGTTTAHS
jgi:hypothetical protein